MPVFQPRNRKQILRQLVARTVARSKLTSLVRTSATLHMLAAFAGEAAEVYFQLARLRDVFSIDLASGSDLDKRAAEIQPGTITRRSAQYARGTVRFNRATTAGTLAIPQGTILSAEDDLGTLRYRTTAAGSILPGNTASDVITIQALARGTRSNVAAGEINRMITYLAGVTTVANDAKVDSGADREGDPDFRARLKNYIASLARGTVRAIESAALSLRGPQGERVLFAKVVEPLPPTGQFSVYIDDGTGFVDTYDSTPLTSPETVLASAVGGEQDLQILNWPIRDDGTFELDLNAVTQARDTDYWLDPTIGRIRLSSPLVATDAIVVRYRYYTGIIQATQRVVSGIRGSRLVPGVRASGIQAHVLPPQRVLQSLVANGTVADDFDAAATLAAASDAVQTYINGLTIGATVIVSEIIERAMAVSGMVDFEIGSLTGSTPPANQIILPSQVARCTAADITIN